MRQDMTKADQQLEEALRTRLQCSATIVGIIIDDPVPIEVQGADELEFEQLRAKNKTESRHLEKAILEKWAKYPWHRQKHNIEANELEQDGYIAIPKAGASTTVRESLPSGILPVLKTAVSTKKSHQSFRKILNPLSQTKPFVKRFMSSENQESLGKAVTGALRHLQKNPEHVLVKHLVERSRQTVLWTDDRSLAVATVIDENSILENRSFATFGGLYTPDDPKLLQQLSWPLEELALVNTKASAGDLIVALKGARVPYVVRALDYPFGFRHNTSSLKELLLASQKQPIKCRLIGECLIDKYERFDMVLGNAKTKRSMLNPTSLIELQ
jgi:hypothetical protein